jgi:hypothetical protein
MKKDYFNDKLSLGTPWVESPFFYKLLDNSNLSNEEKELCKKYHEDGYVIIDLELSDKTINDIVLDMYKSLNETSTVFHPEHVTYTESKRIFEEWKKSDNIANLTVHPKLLKTLELLYAKKPFPFSTINFIKGSNQPLHSDTIHFHTIPSLWMAGVWVALENVDETNGTLQIVPKSHKWPVYEYEDLNLPNPDDIENGEALNYAEYESFIESLVLVNGGEKKIVPLKKGQALIWSANMLHGGCNVDGVTNFEKTRLTQANHYFFYGCDEYYCPMFSKKNKGIYAKKWCNDKNNIETYLNTKK